MITEASSICELKIREKVQLNIKQKISLMLQLQCISVFNKFQHQFVLFSCINIINFTSNKSFLSSVTY